LTLGEVLNFIVLFVNIKGALFMDDATVFVVVSGAIVTAVGWFILHVLERRRSDRKRTIEAKTGRRIVWPSV
jgi:hypothetical protein